MTSDSTNDNLFRTALREIMLISLSGIAYQASVIYITQPQFDARKLKMVGFEVDFPCDAFLGKRNK